MEDEIVESCTTHKIKWKNACNILYVRTWRKDIFGNMCVCERIMV
jgi:hypothetical protein